MNRRRMLQMLGGLTGCVVSAPFAFAADPPRLLKRLGIGMHSYGFHWQAARDRNPNAKFSTALEFLEYCHKLGAGGVQVTITSKEQGDAKRIRAKAESYQMYFEGQLALRNELALQRIERVQETDGERRTRPDAGHGRNVRRGAGWGHRDDGPCPTDKAGR